MNILCTLGTWLVSATILLVVLWLLVSITTLTLNARLGLSSSIESMRRKVVIIWVLGVSVVVRRVVEFLGIGSGNEFRPLKLSGPI